MLQIHTNPEDTIKCVFVHQQTLSMETHKAKFPGVEMHCRNSLNCLIDKEFEFARVHLKIFAIMYLLKDNTTH